MTTTTMVKAWEIAHTMIDNLEYDAYRTERGSGKTWSNTDTGETVIDLGTRLEVNTADGNTVNIWIEPETMNIGIGHMIQAMQLQRFGHDEIMAMREAMITGNFKGVKFTADCYTTDWDDRDRIKG